MANGGHDAAYRREWAIEVLKLLVQRRAHLNEVFKITKELNESLDRNDRVSVQMLLKMRAEELEKVDVTIRSLLAFKEQLGKETEKEIDALMEGRKAEDTVPEMDKIIDVSRECRKILSDIIVIDKQMSRRVAGEDSFYAR